MDNLATLDTDRQRVKNRNPEWDAQDDHQIHDVTKEPEDKDARITKILAVILRVLCG